MNESYTNTYMINSRLESYTFWKNRFPIKSGEKFVFMNFVT